MVDPLERERDAYEIVYVLPQVQFIGVRRVALLEGGLHRNHEVLETSVASDGHTARDRAGGFCRQAVIGHFGRHFQIGIEDFYIPEYLKELRPGVPREVVLSGAQTCQCDYKGLQS